MPLVKFRLQRSLASVKAAASTDEWIALLEKLMCQTGVLSRFLDVRQKNKVDSEPFAQDVSKYYCVNLLKT